MRRMIIVNTFSFLHTSDIHLGYQQFNLDERFADFGAAFGRIVDYALKYKVDFVAVGGDFFHQRAINAETLKQAMELLQPLKDAGIPVITIEGNHDKAFYQDKISWLRLLNGLGYLKLLKPVFTEGRISLTPWTSTGEGCVLELDRARIIGLGYLGATTEQRLAEAASQLEIADKFTILLLHAAVNKFLVQDLGGVKKETLEQFRDMVDYLALGHIHTREEDGWFFNPGALENCHLDEAKEGREKGFYHVTVCGPQKTVEYIPAKPREVRLLTVDITGVRDPAEAYQKVWLAVEGLSLKSLDRPMLQVILRGEVDFSAMAIDTSGLAREIRETCGCLHVEVQNTANLPLYQGDDPGSDALNRSLIEKQVLDRLVARRFPQYREFQGELVDLVIRVKEAALSGESPKDIIAAAAALAGRLPGQETETCGENVAAAGGENLED